MNRLVCCAMLLVSSTAISGCATLVRGSSETVSFLSEPPGAKVTTSVGHECTTPCAMSVRRKDTFNVVFTLGDQSRTVYVGNEVVDGGIATMVGNVLLGGPFGLGYDAANGAARDHTPNPVIVNFNEPEAVVQTAVAQSTTAQTATAHTRMMPVVEPGDNVTQ